MQEERFDRLNMHKAGLKHFCKRKGAWKFFFSKSIFEGSEHQGELPPSAEGMQLGGVDEITRQI